MRDDRRVDSSIASRAARRIENQLWNQISGVKRIHVRTHALRQVSAQIRTGHSSRSSRGSGTYMADVARFFRNRVDRSRRDRRTRQRDLIPDEIIVRHTRAAVDHDQRARQITHSLHEEVHRPWLRSLGVRRPCRAPVMARSRPARLGMARSLLRLHAVDAIVAHICNLG